LRRRAKQHGIERRAPKTAAYSYDPAHESFSVPGIKADLIPPKRRAQRLPIVGLEHLLAWSYPEQEMAKPYNCFVMK
jgi:hypothetical protein